VALADQVMSLDWRARKAKKAGSVEQEVIEEVLAKIAALLS
jgi:mRNA-degrading endonuclease toxin of MazEF toxin-antitoxin module